MVEVAGKPLLDHTLHRLRQGGVRRAILAAGHLGGVISDHYRSNEAYGLELSVNIESRPMGTAGCLHEFAARLDPHFLVVYGDIYLDLDIRPLLDAHEVGNLATLLVRASDHPWDSHVVTINDRGGVTGFFRPGEHPPRSRNITNAALFVCSSRILNLVPENQSSDFSSDVFPAALAQGETLGTYFLPEHEYVKDMGTPERLQDVRDYADWQLAVQAARHRREVPVRYAFIDRDGTLVEGSRPVDCRKKVQFLPGALDGLRTLHQNGVRCYVVTNQPWIARGEMTFEQMEAVHRWIRVVVEESGGLINDFYCCPHHPETHHGEGATELRRGCDCRKPQTGLIRRVWKEHDVNLGQSVMIGDSWRDVQTGVASGMRTIRIGRAQPADLHPEDAYARDFLEATKIILTWNCELR
jgi:histidinol-phosphate phosphatase family protein